MSVGCCLSAEEEYTLKYQAIRNNMRQAVFVNIWIVTFLYIVIAYTSCVNYILDFGFLERLFCYLQFTNNSNYSTYWYILPNMFNIIKY